MSFLERWSNQENLSSIYRLCSLSGVSPFIAKRLQKIGLFHPEDFRDKDPHDLYQQIKSIDDIELLTLLPILKCACYVASMSSQEHDEGLLQWWHWIEA